MGPVFLVRSAGDLGRALQQARLASGMTQEELSEATGVDRTYLARMESGLSVLLLERLMRLLRYTGAEVTVTLPDRAPDRAATPAKVRRAVPSVRDRA